MSKNDSPADPTRSCDTRHRSSPPSRSPARSGNPDAPPPSQPATDGAPRRHPAHPSGSKRTAVAEEHRSGVDLTDPAQRATAHATASYAKAFRAEFQDEFYREPCLALTLSSLGVGTYLGEPTDDEDARYGDTIARALESGVNVVDTAINYRCQRSERAVGAALESAIARGRVRRDQILICTKGGYIPLDGTPPATRQAYQQYVEQEFFAPGVMLPEDVVAGGHCLTPTFLKYCIAKSRQNLGVRTIDLYYLHNPEQQAPVVPPQELHLRLRNAFATLEESVARRDIGAYGCATWNALRIPPSAKAGHLSLEELVKLARDVAGDGHHFRAVQVPINIVMSEAVRVPTQPLGSRLVPLLEAARELGLTVFASAPLMQSQLVRGLPDTVRSLFPQATSDAGRALTFVRTLPGVACALTGMRSAEHLEENLASVRRS